MDYGEASNNEAELHTLKRGLEIALRDNIKRLQIEGDSKLVIDMVRKLQQQTPVERTSKSWRTTWLVSEIGKLIPKIEYLIPTHTRRAGNKPENWLANWGYRNRGREIDSEGLPQLHQEEENQLQQLLDEDTGKKSMRKTNGHDQGACNGGDDTRDLQGSDNSYVRNDRGVRQANDVVDLI